MSAWMLLSDHWSLLHQVRLNMWVSMLATLGGLFTLSIVFFVWKRNSLGACHKCPSGGSPLLHQVKPCSHPCYYPPPLCHMIVSINVNKAFPPSLWISGIYWTKSLRGSCGPEFWVTSGFLALFILLHLKQSLFVYENENPNEYSSDSKRWCSDAEHIVMLSPYQDTASNQSPAPNLQD